MSGSKVPNDPNMTKEARTFFDKMSRDATAALAVTNALDQVDNTSDATKNAAVATLTNKTLTSPTITTPAVTGGTFSAPAIAGPLFSGMINLGALGTKTIAGGAITVTQPFFSVDTQGGAGTDDLDTINGGADGDFIIFRVVSGTRTVVVKSGTGNIVNVGGDLSLNVLSQMVLYVFDGSNWRGGKLISA